LANPIKTAILGVGGFSGGELVRLLLDHPNLTLHPPLLLGRSGAETVALISVHPQLSHLPNADSLRIIPFDLKLLQEEEIDILFLATPHEQSREDVPAILGAGIRVVDLSGAWRLQSEANRSVYKLSDVDPSLAAKLQTEAVYGSPELHAPEITNARLVANPGCYATSIILALAPLLRANLVDLDHGIICDAKSGVSGAGKAATATTHFMNAADNLSAYAVFGHRHTGELLEQLHLTNAQIQFTPHLLPIPRGILSTIYVRLSSPGNIMGLQSCFDAFYSEASMVRIRKSPQLPQIQHVVRTSFCDIGFQLAPDGQRLVIVSCLDNLLKGAASQAVQNMNLMAGFPETAGLL
jgi:N-acetyl-gamma-glutamyl-phosphate reductase